MDNKVSRQELKKRLREKIKNGKELNQMKQRMSVPKKTQAPLSVDKRLFLSGNLPSGPVKLTKPGLDFSMISKMSDKELLALSSMCDLEVAQLRQLAKLATTDNHKVAEIFDNHHQSAKMEGIKRRQMFLERFEKEGRFPIRDSLSSLGEPDDKEDKELHLILAFMDRLQTDKSLNEEQKDKMRAMIMLYHKNRGLNKYTPSLEDWVNLYGLSPDEILKKNTYKGSTYKGRACNDSHCKGCATNKEGKERVGEVGQDDADLSDLSED
jgi:hypothetical protein